MANKNKYEDIFNPKSRAGIDKTIQDAIKSGELEKTWLANDMLFGAGAHTGMKTPGFWEYLKSIVGMDPTYVAKVPTDDDQSATRRYLAMGSPSAVLSEKDVADAKRVTAMHELAERASMILGNKASKDRFQNAGVGVGMTVGTYNLLASKKPSMYNVVAPIVLGRYVGKLLDKAKEYLWKTKADMPTKSLKYKNFAKELYASHTDPAVIASESNTLAVLGNPSVLKSYTAIRNMTGEMAPISKALPQYGKKIVNALDEDLRTNIKKEYENYANSTLGDKIINDLPIAGAHRVIDFLRNLLPFAS